MRRSNGPWRTAGLAAALALAGSAAGQTLGPVGLPQLPTGPVGGVVDDTLGAAHGATDPALAAVPLKDLHAVRVRELVRRYPKQIDVDEAGEAVVRDEVVVLSPSDGALAAAEAAGFTVARDAALEPLGLRLVVLRAPHGLDTRQAVARLRHIDPAGRYEFNHLYAGAGGAGQASGGDAGGTGAGARLGLIDSGVAQAHPAFAGVRLEQRGFAPGGLVVGAHGTAVASLAAGSGGGVRGAAPGAALLVADVYGAGPAGGSAEAIARGMAWLVERHAPVINVSLVGPPDATLEAAVRAVIARGVLVVAAVGNDGPAAQPLYPASYPGVIAVTAVDARGRLLPEAGRARHVDFAAPGVGLRAATPGGGVASVRGTSFAAPIVAARLALLLKAPDPVAAREAVSTLAAEARDAGPRGEDADFGKGIVEPR